MFCSNTLVSALPWKQGVAACQLQSRYGPVSSSQQVHHSPVHLKFQSLAKQGIGFPMQTTFGFNRRKASAVVTRCSASKDNEAKGIKEADSAPSGGSVTTTAEKDGPKTEPPNPSEAKADETPKIDPSSSLSSTSPSSSPAPLPSQPSENKPPKKEPLKFDTVTVVQLLAPEKVSQDDVAAMKSKLFGYKTFFVTGQEPFGEADEGILIRGNLRGKKEVVYDKLRRGMQEMFGNKYELLMIEEPPLPGGDMAGLAEPEVKKPGEKRVSFVMFRSEVTLFPPTPAWQYFVAVILLAITGGCCLELGLVAQVRGTGHLLKRRVNTSSTPSGN